MHVRRAWFGVSDFLLIVLGLGVVVPVYCSVRVDVAKLIFQRVPIWWPGHNAGLACHARILTSPFMDACRYFFFATTANGVLYVYGTPSAHPLSGLVLFTRRVLDVTTGVGYSMFAWVDALPHGELT